MAAGNYKIRFWQSILKFLHKLESLTYNCESSQAIINTKPEKNKTKKNVGVPNEVKSLCTVWDHCSCQQCPKHEWGAEPLSRVWAEVCFLYQHCRFEFHVIFCINWRCTEKQTWIFTSSWSEYDFDVTSKDLLNLCLRVLGSAKELYWAGCSEASFYSWKPLANISQCQVDCRQM